MTHALFISDLTFWMIDFHESHVPIEHAIFVVNVIPIKSLVANAVEKYTVDSPLSANSSKCQIEKKPLTANCQKILAGHRTLY